MNRPRRLQDRIAAYIPKITMRGRRSTSTCQCRCLSFIRNAKTSLLLPHLPEAQNGEGRESAFHHRVTEPQRKRRRVTVRGFLCVSVSLLSILFLPIAAYAQQTFRDVTAQAGIRFNHNNGAFGKKWLPETMGPGCAFIDYDNDGYPDILLVNGEDWPGHNHAGATTPKLYHNNRNGTFTDVTRQAGLAVPMFGMGVAVGDYDNDGFDDLFITALGQSHLFHNNGNGTPFTEVTKPAGMWGPNEFSLPAQHLGRLRPRRQNSISVVANYVRWSEQTDLYCTLDGAHTNPIALRSPTKERRYDCGTTSAAASSKMPRRRRASGDPNFERVWVSPCRRLQRGWLARTFLIASNDTQPSISSI